MPAYFFHIALELYPSRSPPDSAFTPPPQTDIFDPELPIHRTLSWSSLATAKRPQALLTPVASSSDVTLSGNHGERRANSRRFSHRARASFAEHGESPVPVFKPPTRPAHKRTQSFAHKDWRFDAITLQSIDMNTGSGEDASRPRAKSLKQPTHPRSSGGLATKGKFIPSDLKETDVGWGVVHLYRDDQETPGLYDDAGTAAGSSGGAGTEFDEEDCTTLCILAVPSYMTPSDFLGFVGEDTREHVSHFRLIRTSRANKYMVLMKFREAERAREWRKEWNGKTFNSMEPEYCHVVFVKSISFQNGDSNRDPSSYPNLTNDPFTPAPTAEPTAPLPSSVETLTTKPLAPPTPSLVELPTCPVCLERMDESTGLLTILCQHVFHCACLEKWRGSGCPVCRYTQNDAFVGLRGSHPTSTSEDEENFCSVCGSTSNLWICLICGNIGCGRYDSAHAFAHYEATSHTYAMDVGTQRVWDYTGDAYVHRLIQNKADGKSVDMPASTHPNSMTSFASDTIPREKMDTMTMEYTYLLTSQLESQRAYFEEQVERAADKAKQAARSAEEATKALTSFTQKFEDLQIQYKDAQTQIQSLEKEAARNAMRATQAQELARKLTKQYKEEQTMNESLMTRIKHLETKAQDADARVKQIEAEKADLEEQNRDLSFFISGQEKLKEMQGNEIMGLQEGEVEAGTLEVGASKKRKGKKKAQG
ncbi:BRCA1-associated protein 2-domain-containing protein [Lophiotrema nucula]|uniref:BRCA1-associated protein 2-domain-containing protein n=1 Tax=Lophiotrema nucula TaxID=690887 RepID=A0A6A5Z9D9_9PLEO|nr:BRCA1-associated protein 2-domain-containing protein [Lophiotrema nucula]